MGWWGRGSDRSLSWEDPAHRGQTQHMTVRPGVTCSLSSWGGAKRGNPCHHPSPGRWSAPALPARPVLPAARPHPPSEAHGSRTAHGRPAEPQDLSAPRACPSSGCCLPFPLPLPHHSPPPPRPASGFLLPGALRVGAPRSLGLKALKGSHPIASARVAHSTGIRASVRFLKFLPSVLWAVQTPGALGCVETGV